MSYQDGVETIEFNSAREFLAYLRPSGTFDSFEWIFRGLPDESYSLLPTLLRDPADMLVERYYRDANRQAMDNLIFTFQLYIRNGQNFRRSRVYFTVEHRLLAEFAMKADRVGLPIPGLESMLNLSIDVHSPVNSLPFLQTYDYRYNLVATQIVESIKENKGIPPAYTGLAQHHGIPTRLLDFTFNPLKAIYFAVQRSVPSRICIWVVNKILFSDEIFVKWPINFSGSGAEYLSKYSMLIMPNSSNKYMHQQQGLFVYPRFPFEYNFEFGRFPDLRDFIRLSQPLSTEENPRAFKLILHENQFQDLKDLIRREGLTLSTMMPSFDNVAEEIKNDVGIYRN